MAACHRIANAQSRRLEDRKGKSCALQVLEVLYRLLGEATESKNETSKTIFDESVQLCVELYVEFLCPAFMSSFYVELSVELLAEVLCIELLCRTSLYQAFMSNHLSNF